MLDNKIILLEAQDLLQNLKEALLCLSTGAVTDERLLTIAETFKKQTQIHLFNVEWPLIHFFRLTTKEVPNLT